MKFAADFHLHSRFSRATSKETNLETLGKWAEIKGVKVLGTGDFTHPGWLQELKEKLEPAEKGLYKLKSEKNGVRFILTAEISCIYSKKNKVRKIHILIFSPSFEVVEKINNSLSEIGNLKSDGRPILGLDAKELAKISLNISPDCLVIPAHCMTPWFAVFGSKSGFDSLEECFEDYSKYIYAVETGLSADPKMLWQMPCLDKVSLISNSDAHSPEKIGREANVFDTELSYESIAKALKEKDPGRFLYTIEFFPEEGKYHYDGHRLCNISLSPQETKKYNGICPVCARPLTVGVLSRTQELSKSGRFPQNNNPFKSLIPLKEIIADCVGVLPGAKQVKTEYEKLIKNHSELEILLDVPKENLSGIVLPEIAEGIIRVREGKVSIVPGYDGTYGKISIFSKQERKSAVKQESLFQ